MRSWLTAPAQQTPVHSDRPAVAAVDSVGWVVVARVPAAVIATVLVTVMVLEMPSANPVAAVAA